MLSDLWAGQSFTRNFFSHGLTMNRFLVLVLFLLLLVLAPVVGCGGDRNTYANVKGTVMFNDKPLDKGNVIFTVEGKPPSVIDVIDGKFAGQAIVGSNKVSVSATRKSTTKRVYPKEAEDQRKAYKKQGKAGDNAEDSDYQVVELIPPDWGSESKHTYAVETGAANEFNLTIKGPG
jgi:hypothetical protein